MYLACAQKLGQFLPLNRNSMDPRANSSFDQMEREALSSLLINPAKASKLAKLVVATTP